MEKDLSNYRKAYKKGILSFNDTPETPMPLFHEWFNEIDDHFPETEANAMTLSTIGLDGFPKSRVVLLKKIIDNSFVFFTNYESEKGKAILANPKVCLSFFWVEAERQVIIKGNATKTTNEVSDNYFKSRPKGSQLGAIVSKQSEIIDNRASLDKRIEELEKEYKNKPVLRPDFWGGFIVKPIEIEFWQGRNNRLHDRINYTLNQDYSSWSKHRLSP